MARRVINAEEEARLVAEAEARRDDETYWDFKNPRPIVRGDIALLAVEVPVDQLPALEKAAARKGISLTELINEAVRGAAG